MDNKNLYPISAFLFVLFITANNIANAASFMFSSPLTNQTISEDSGTFNGSVNYNPANWNPNNVTSASLKIFLSDDISATFGSVIDSPREWARLASVSDGSIVQNGLNLDVEVDPHLFGSNHPGFDIAAAAGIEDPNVPPSTAGYFDFDVTNLIKNSNSGILGFSLVALALYDDVLPTDPAYQLILDDAAASGFPFPFDPLFIPVFEDFIFNQAELTVQVTAPPAFFLIGVGLLGLICTRKKQL